VAGFRKPALWAAMEDMQSLNRIAGCATDIPSIDQLMLKVDDDDSIVRVFPGVEDMEVK
jgi:hypothetical protein